MPNDADAERREMPDGATAAGANPRQAKLRYDGLRYDGLRYDGLRYDGLRYDGLRYDELRRGCPEFCVRRSVPRHPSVIGPNVRSGWRAHAHLMCGSSPIGNARGICHIPSGSQSVVVIREIHCAATTDAPATVRRRAAVMVARAHVLLSTLR
jgi:hypothetical protein